MGRQPQMLVSSPIPSSDAGEVEQLKATTQRAYWSNTLKSGAQMDWDSDEEDLQTRNTTSTNSEMVDSQTSHFNSQSKPNSPDRILHPSPSLAPPSDNQSSPRSAPPFNSQRLVQLENDRPQKLDIRSAGDDEKYTESQILSQNDFGGGGEGEYVIMSDGEGQGEEAAQGCSQSSAFSASVAKPSRLPPFKQTMYNFSDSSPHSPLRATSRSASRATSTLPPSPSQGSQHPRPLANSTRRIASSSSSSSSPSPEPEVVVLEPSPEPIDLGRRSFRTRTAAQLKPYSVEQFKYTKTLLKNGWRGAVVAGPRKAELSAEEMKRRREAADGRERDSLGGWLEFQEERGEDVDDENARRAPLRDDDEFDFNKRGESDEDEDSRDQESLDGDDLLELEARKSKLNRDIDAVFRGQVRKNEKGKKREKGKQKERLYVSESDFDLPPGSHHHEQDRERERANNRPRKKGGHSSSKYPAGSTSKSNKVSTHYGHPFAAGSPKRSVSSDGEADQRKRRKDGAGGDGTHSKKRNRGASEPPSSQTLAEGKEEENGFVARKSKKSKASDLKGTKKGPLKQSDVNARGGSGVSRAKDLHAYRKAGNRHAELDAAVMSLKGPTPRPKNITLDLTNENSSEDESWDEEELDDEEVYEEEDVDMAEQKRLNDLHGGRKKALGRMMPAVFFKKAVQDLKLMQEEQDRGELSDFDLGSGDEDRDDNDDEVCKRGRGTLRFSPSRRDRVERNGVFTDESGADSDRSTPSEDNEAAEEADAVSTWLQAFAPRRSGGVRTEDHLEQLLSGTRRVAQRPRPATGLKRGQRGDQSNKTKDRDKNYQKGRKVVNSEVASSTPRSSRPSRPRGRPVNHLVVSTRPLDTHESIFDFISLAEQHREALRAISEHQKTASEFIDKHVVQSNTFWSAFTKFSPDFGVTRLPLGIRFHPTSFITLGHLHSLFSPSPSSETPPFRVSIAHGIRLESTMSAEEIESALPPLCDAIIKASSAFLQTSMSVTGEDLSPERAGKETYNALRFLGSFLTESSSCWPDEIAHGFARAFGAHLDRLETRLNLNSDPIQEGLIDSHRLHLISISWYLVDLAFRLLSSLRLTPNPDRDGAQSRFNRFAVSLVHQLVQYGPGRSMDSLKRSAFQTAEAARVSDPEAPIDQPAIDDPSLEAWTSLVNLAVHPNQNFSPFKFSEEDLWNIVLAEVDSVVPREVRDGPVPGEVACFIATLLSALSQISATGQSLSAPRLQGHWPVMMLALKPIKVEDVAREEESSFSALARRDRFILTLLVRCRVFIERWAWKPEARGEILSKFFTILNARHLADLSVETRTEDGVFPPFLLDLNQFGDCSVQNFKLDTAFITFLKLIISTAAHVVAHQPKILTRMLMRVSPMTAGCWNRGSPEFRGGTSSLINTFSLLVTLAVLSPTTATSRLEQARNLVDFANVPHGIRVSCIRAMLLFANAFRTKGVELAPLVEWYSAYMVILRNDYAKLEQRARIGGRPSDRDPQYHLVIEMCLILRLIRHMITWDTSSPPTYPEVSFLHPACISELLESESARDPLLGGEILDCLRDFLNARSKALPAPLPTSDEPGISQDEFESFDLDFDDPLLNQMLGVDVNVALDVRTANDTKDKEFAEIVAFSISPALHRLLITLYSPVSSTPGAISPEQLSEYAKVVIDCWISVLAVPLQHQITTWAPILGLGSLSWRKINRETGVMLAVRALRLDSSAFEECHSEILNIVVQGPVALNLSEHPLLFASLLNLDPPPFLLTGHGIELDEDENGKLSISSTTYDACRLQIIRAFFRNLGPILATSFGAGNPTLTKSTANNLIRSILGSMKDNLMGATEVAVRDRYANLCRQVFSEMAVLGGSVTETLFPDLTFLNKELAATR
ncbi:hypothetical protein T439DRAFT_378677 [Meredithblackwellia eburnea MCA 4105]